MFCMCVLQIQEVLTFVKVQSPNRCKVLEVLAVEKTHRSRNSGKRPFTQEVPTVVKAQQVLTVVKTQEVLSDAKSMQ